jgi:transposase
LPIGDRHDHVCAVDIRREDDPEQLRRIALTQQVQIKHLLDVLRAQSDQLDELRGTSGDLQEKLALLNALEAQAKKDGLLVDDAPQAKKTKKKRKRFGSTPQPELVRESKLFELDEPDMTCPACGGCLHALEGQHESSEMVHAIAVEYRLIDVLRQKYVCECGGHVATAPGPERAITGGRYSLDFAIKVAIDKYLDHIPLSRQQRIMKRHGLNVVATTLWDQTLALACELKPAYDALKARALSYPVIGLDQTGWPRLSKRTKRGEKNKKWQMWCLSASDVVFHALRDDKSAVTFADLVEDFEGTIVCDGLLTHPAGVREVAVRMGSAPEAERIKLAGCWAHARRKLADAEKDYPQARIALDLIRELYDIDQDDNSNDDLATRRRTRSRDVVDRLKAWLMTQAVLKESTIGAAIRYPLKYWSWLTRFLDDPRVPLDNNATERAFRGPVVGRKNHYGSKSAKGTEVAAIFYSLLETAKLVGVDPTRYLREAILAARRGEPLLPHQLLA